MRVEYYENMLVADQNEFLDVSDEMNKFSLRERDVKETISRMNNERALEPERVPIEPLKCSPEKFCHLLTYIFNSFLRGEELRSNKKPLISVKDIRIKAL